MSAAQKILPQLNGNPAVGWLLACASFVVPPTDISPHVYTYITDYRAISIVSQKKIVRENERIGEAKLS
jgi:hypothetical protein